MKLDLLSLSFLKHSSGGQNLSRMSMGKSLDSFNVATILQIVVDLSCPLFF
jgi:hypothetical protein